jgi:hypothetical protein
MFDHVLIIAESQNDNGDMSACGDDTFCCDGDQSVGACNCENKIGVVTVPNGPVQTVLFISGGQTSTSSFVYNPSTSTPSSSPTSSFSTGTSTSVPSSTTSPAPAPKKKKSKTGLIAGVAVAGAIVLAVFAFMIYKICFHQKQEGGQEGGDGSQFEPYFVAGSSAPTNIESSPSMAQNNASRHRNGNGLNPFASDDHSRSATPANGLSVRNGLASRTTLDRSEYNA